MSLMKSAFVSLAAIVFLVSVAAAQQPALKLTAASANVSEPGNAVRIDIARWSTDQERNQLFALTPPAPPAPAAADDPDAPPSPFGRGNRGGGGRGGGNNAQRGGRGGAA